MFCKVERSHRKPPTAWWRPTTHQVTFGQGAATISTQRMQTWLWSGLHVRCMLTCEQHAWSPVVAHVPELHAVIHNRNTKATERISTVPLTVVSTQASNCKQCKIPKLNQRNKNIVHKPSVSFARCPWGRADSEGMPHACSRASPELHMQTVEKHSNALWPQTWFAVQSASGRATCLLVRIRGDAYAYSGESGAFTRVPRMPVDLPDQMQQAQQALASITTGWNL